MPAKSSIKRRPSAMASFTVSKRLCLHEAKFPKGAEIGFGKSSARPFRNKHPISYSESDDEEEEEEEEEEEKEDQELRASSNSEIEEITPAAFEAAVRPSQTTNQSKEVESEAAKIFKNMATEIHQLITEFLDADCDIARYALVCKTTGVAVTSSVWRQRFQRTFDFDDSLSTAEMLLKYKYRRLVSKQWTCFDLDRFGGASQTYEIQQVQIVNQEHCLDMLRSLIIDSNARKVRNEDGQEIVRGRNLQFIQDMITGNNGMSYVDIIDSVFCTVYDKDIARTLNSAVKASDQGSTLYNVQLCLAAYSLHPKYSNVNVSHFDISQHQVYSAPSSQPMFLDKWKQSINTRWLVHVVNFFKYHLKAEGEGLLTHDYSDLDPDQYPQPWAGNIQAGTCELATYWKGAYMYLDQDTLQSSRSTKPSGKVVHTDSLDGGETFQDLSIFFDSEQYPNQRWPTLWETILDSDPFKDLDVPRRRRASPRNTNQSRPEIKQFWGTSRGAKTGHFFGRIHAMVPQNGIHGFQRLTMMKFYTKLEDDEEVYDPLQVWAYEGCVLPGGRIIIGRWWDAGMHPTNEHINSGPFIWWNVDRSGAARPINKNEAFDFLDSFKDTEVGVI